MKSLAIDTTIENQKEAEKWTKLFLAIFNDKNIAFCLKDLKNAIQQLPRDLERALIQKFNLFELDEVSDNVNPEIISNALLELYLLDAGKTAYSVNAKIEHLQDLQNKVISDSSFYEEWNIDIKTLNISVRSKNGLVRSGIKTLNDLFSTRLYDLERIRNIGRKCLDEEILPLFKEYGVEPLTY